MAVSTTADGLGISTRRPHVATPDVWAFIVLFIYKSYVLVEGKGELDYLAVFLPQRANGGANILEVSAIEDTVASIEVPFMEHRKTYTILAGQTKTFRYPSRLRTSLQEFQSNKTIHIRTSRPVTVKGLNAMASSADSFLALPIGEDFTHFRAISYTQTHVRPQCVLTVASLLGRNIVNIASTLQISFRHGDRFYRHGETLRVRLERLQTVQVESYDVTGLLVTSFTPVAVYSGCNCVSVPKFSADCDHVVEQVPPLATWGTEFVSGALAGRQSGEIFRVLSSCNATQVRVNGHGRGVVNEGEFLEFNSEIQGASRIECSNPCLVALFIQGYSVDNKPGDPAMVVLPHTGQWVSTGSVSWSSRLDRPQKVVRVFHTVTHYVMVMTESVHTVGTLLDGKVLGSGRHWVRIPNTNYSVNVFQEEPGEHRIQHANPRVKFGIILYGLGAGVSYAHPGDLDLKTNPDRGCKLSMPAGPSNIHGGSEPEGTEVQTYTNMPVVISLACMCVGLLLVIVFFIMMTLRIRRKMRHMEKQEKIIIVPRPSRPIIQPLPRTEATTVSTNENGDADVTAPVNPPPYIEILDDS